MTTIPGIGQFDPSDDHDAQTWARITDFVLAHGPAAFSRDPHIGGHITASAFVLSPDGASTLLTHHRKLDMWIQLGGHCDGIMDAPFVALKEAYEESGLLRLVSLRDVVFDVDIHQIPETPKEPAHLHYDCRFLLQAADTSFSVSEESHALAWVPLSQLETYTDEPSVLRMRDRL